MFELASAYRTSGMAAYAQVQETEFARQASSGYQAVKHQRFVGTGYFDQVAQCVAAGRSSTTALTGSTEEEQFESALKS
jgi:isocitrate lyase